MVHSWYSVFGQQIILIYFLQSLLSCFSFAIFDLFFVLKLCMDKGSERDVIMTACHMGLPCFLFENHLLLQLKVHQKKMMNHTVLLPHFCFQPKVPSWAYYKEKVLLVLANYK